MKEAIARLTDGRLRVQADAAGGGEWSLHRKRLLIDSVLRGWPIGTLHVVRADKDGAILQVVDGQRRLSTLREFLRGELDVDGRITPPNQVLREANGKQYPNLSPGLRAAFRDYPLVLQEIEGIPAAELRSALVRLNDSTGMSAAGRQLVEAGSFGEQVRELVLTAIDWGLNEERIGFSNAGLAYDDVISRVLVAVEFGDIRTAASESKELTDHLRSGRPVTERSRTEVAEALKELLSLPALDRPAVRFVKVTLISWLLVMVYARRRFGAGSEHHLGFLMGWLEPQRHRLAARLDLDEAPPLRSVMQELPHKALLKRLNEAVAVRANTSEAVVFRDAVLWLFFVATGGAPSRRTPPVPALMEIYDVLRHPDVRRLNDDELDDALWEQGDLESWGVWH
ncbi:DUF262 domain-containing protein [Streptomyces collinus]|uniref:DUF262 domain-containing protein n=1 Tax=Streptomyces collinus TaxID=42684 RepID=UPI003692FFCB